jgi:predicted Zn-dependent protease
MRALRFLIAFAGAFALIWLASEALRNGSANARVYGASKEMGTWVAAGSRPGAGTRDSVRAELERALNSDPADPAIHELLGILEARSPERPEYLTSAGVHFAKALELRPTSPYTWASLAEAKYQMGDTSAGFENALIRAAQLGPSEPEVQRIVANYGLAVRDEVSPRARASIDAMVAAGFNRNPLEMLQIGDRRGKLSLVCRHFNDIPRHIDPKWSQLCQSTEATP